MSYYAEIDYTVSSMFIPAIINDDFTGLDEGDILELTTFLDSNTPSTPHAWVVKAIDNDPELDRCEISNLYCECETLTLLTKPN